MEKNMILVLSNLFQLQEIDLTLMQVTLLQTNNLSIQTLNYKFILMNQILKKIVFIIDKTVSEVNLKALTSEVPIQAWIVKACRTFLWTIVINIKTKRSYKASNQVIGTRWNSVTKMKKVTINHFPRWAKL